MSTYFHFESLKSGKKNDQFEKISETDFRIRLVESQNHGMKPKFSVKNQKPPVAEAINVKFLCGENEFHFTIGL